jgi:hypothetical protein
MPRVPKLVLPALAALAIAAAVTACGSSSPKPLTRAQLTAKANAICRRVNAKLASVGTIKGTAQIARVTSRLSAFEQSTLAQLSALVPPAALESDWKRFVDGAQSLAEATAKLGEDAATKKPNAIGPLLASAEATQRRMTTLARRDGFTACANVP